jgi:hypothetical protein
VRYYRSMQNVEHRFRVLKDFLELRPVFHWTESRVRGHVAVCVLAATIEAVVAKDLVNAKVDPDLPFQSMTPRRALSLLKEVRLELVSGAITTSSSSAGEAHKTSRGIKPGWSGLSSRVGDGNRTRALSLGTSFPLFLPGFSELQRTS